MINIHHSLLAVSGDPTGCQGMNRAWPCARQTPSPSCYLSNPRTCVRAFCGVSTSLVQPWQLIGPSGASLLQFSFGAHSFQHSNGGEGRSVRPGVSALGQLCLGVAPAGWEPCLPRCAPVHTPQLGWTRAVVECRLRQEHMGSCGVAQWKLSLEQAPGLGQKGAWPSPTGALEAKGLGFGRRSAPRHHILSPAT